MDDMAPRRFPWAFWLIVTGIALAGVTCLSLAMTVEADAHDALPTAAQPNGWAYPVACCSGYDCRAVGDSRSGAPIRVYETAEGYRISTTGEVIPMLDRKVRPSPDGEFHWCSVGGKADGKTICLFAPPRGF